MYITEQSQLKPRVGRYHPSCLIWSRYLIEPAAAEPYDQPFGPQMDVGYFSPVLLALDRCQRACDMDNIIARIYTAGGRQQSTLGRPEFLSIPNRGPKCHADPGR